MMDYYLVLDGVGSEKDDFVSSVSSACGSLGEFLGEYTHLSPPMTNPNDPFSSRPPVS